MGLTYDRICVKLLIWGSFPCLGVYFLGFTENWHFGIDFCMVGCVADFVVFGFRFC